MQTNMSSKNQSLHFKFTMVTILGKSIITINRITEYQHKSDIFTSLAEISNNRIAVNQRKYNNYIFHQKHTHEKEICLKLV